VGRNPADNGKAGGVTLHFAYGSNMSRAVMRRHAPGAEPVGVATLANYRFLITTHGHASVALSQRSTVHGVVWRLGVRDCVTLAAWENIAGGLYRAATLPVRQAGQRRLALVYLARSQAEAAPQAGYMDVVIAAALEWHLPAPYIEELRSWSLRRPQRLKAFRWT
jgi:AIG2 family protein